MAPLRTARVVIGILALGALAWSVTPAGYETLFSAFTDVTQPEVARLRRDSAAAVEAARAAALSTGDSVVAAVFQTPSPGHDAQRAYAYRWYVVIVVACVATSLVGFVRRRWGVGRQGEIDSSRFRRLEDYQ